MTSARAVAGRGLDGDRAAAGHSRLAGGSKRQVTLFQAEHLPLLAAWLGAGVGLELSGPCEPCSKMEFELGAGACNALRGHGGVTARVVTGGELRVGDRVWVEAMRVEAPSA